MEEFLEDTVAIEVFFQDDENKIGFKPVEDEDGDGYTLSRSNDTGSITPMSFFNWHQLTPDITTQYAPVEEEIELDGETVSVVSIDLDDEIVTYGRRRVRMNLIRSLSRQNSTPDSVFRRL